MATRFSNLAEISFVRKYVFCHCQKYLSNAPMMLAGTKPVIYFCVSKMIMKPVRLVYNYMFLLAFWDLTTHIVQ